jgi:micrococcal nuclease
LFYKMAIIHSRFRPIAVTIITGKLFFAVLESLVGLALIFMMILGPADAKELLPGPVRAEVVRVVDGDSLVLRARIWLGQCVKTQVRVGGVDTPKVKGKCEIERRHAKAARAFFMDQLSGNGVHLHDIHYGKYAGRVIARVVLADGRDLAKILIKAGLGRAYAGGRRRPVCQ